MIATAAVAADCWRESMISRSTKRFILDGGAVILVFTLGMTQEMPPSVAVGAIAFIAGVNPADMLEAYRIYQSREIEVEAVGDTTDRVESRERHDE